MKIMLEKNITLGEAEKLLQNRVDEGHKENKLFLEGDHWQDGKGFPSLPPIDVENRQAIIDTIHDAFASENVISEIVERHLDGVIAREPSWDLVDLLFESEEMELEMSELSGEKSDENSEENIKQKLARLKRRLLFKRFAKDITNAIIGWWNGRKMLELMRESLTTTLIQERCVIRAFVPPGFVDDEGNIEMQKTFADALKMIQFEVLSADVAGVFQDTERYEPYGIFADGDGKDRKIELTYLDSDGKTCLKVFEEESLHEFMQKTLPQIAEYMSPDDDENKLPEINPLNLNGNLLMYEMSRKPLINEQMRSLQKQTNLTWTMSGKNIVTAGSRERYFSNVARRRKQPKNLIKNNQPGQPNNQPQADEYEDMQIGGSTANFLQGAPIYREEAGRKVLVGFADANVIIVDPVEAALFDKHLDKLKSTMLGMASQNHVEQNDVSQTSGLSKQEGRAGFEKSLKRSKGTLDGAGRWMIDVAMRFAAAHTLKQSNNNSNKQNSVTLENEFQNVRVDFNAIVDAGAVDAEQAKVDREDVEKGLMTLETYQSRRGIEDPEAENSRLFKTDIYILTQLKRRLEVAVLAKNLGLPPDEVLTIAGYDEEQKKKLIPLMNVSSGEKKPENVDQ